MGGLGRGEAMVFESSKRKKRRKGAARRRERGKKLRELRQWACSPN